MQKLLTVKDFQSLAGVSKNTIYDWCRRGIIPKIKIGKRVLIPADQAKKILEGGTE